MQDVLGALCVVREKGISDLVCECSQITMSLWPPSSNCCMSFLITLVLLRKDEGVWFCLGFLNFDLGAVSKYFI